MLKLLRWLSALAYIGGLTLLLVADFPQEGVRIPQLDKLGHFLAFALLAVLLLRAMTPPRYVRPALWACLTAIAVATTYGVLMEFVQIQAGRGFEIADMLADTLGAVVGILLWTHYRKRFLFIR